MKWILVDAVVWQKGNLIRDLIDEHQTSDMVRVDCATLRAQEQSIITGTYVREESSLSTDCADKLALGVQDQYLAVRAKNQHKACEFRDDTLLDLLLDVNALFKLECALVHLPDFEARSLNS